jgi:hypothetical protein
MGCSERLPSTVITPNKYNILELVLRLILHLGIKKREYLLNLSRTIRTKLICGIKVNIMYLKGYLDGCWMNALTILCMTSV